jgi:hypothetical protein
MKNLKKLSKIILLFAILIACKKAVDTVPIVKSDAFTGCRISQIESGSIPFINTYNPNGFLISSIVKYSFSEVTYKYSYENGLIIGLIGSDKNEEKYEYKNGALSKIFIVNTIPGLSQFKGYFIDIDTDNNKRIVKMTDSNGLQNEITRDASGNIMTIIQTNNTDKRVNYKIELSGYDGKKTIYDLLKGFPFDFTSSYEFYMTQGVLLSVGGTGGNATKIKIWDGQNQISDVDIKYEYSPTGYPTLINQIENMHFLPNRILKIGYQDCK